VNVGSAPALSVEVAATHAARQHGLMDRDELAADRGMLFLFPEQTTSAFWMFQTRVPLSIAFVDGDRVVSIAEMEPCPSTDGSGCPTYPPAGPYTFAVEAPAGHFSDAGVQPGDPVRITGTLPTAAS
jgi:uncharacterized membrane protein (UPF0127 family)